MMLTGWTLDKLVYGTNFDSGSTAVEFEMFGCPTRGQHLQNGLVQIPPSGE
jgi:hypothetical protein